MVQLKFGGTSTETYLTLEGIACSSKTLKSLGILHNIQPIDMLSNFHRLSWEGNNSCLTAIERTVSVTFLNPDLLLY